MPGPERLILLVALILAGAAAGARAGPVCPAGDAPFPALYPDPAPFAAAIERTRDAPVSPTPLSGLAVPHHLLVPDLIAAGIRAASGVRPERIVVLSPDHFRRLARPFGVATRGFQTPFGPVDSDVQAAASLLARLGPRAEVSCLFAAEHGVQAVLPFLRRAFPGVPVIAVAVALRSDRGDWQAMAEALSAVSGDGALVVQSTDFSHFLPAAEARVRDQQTLNVLAAGSPDAIAGLDQPAHVDSVGAFFIQAAIQASRGAEPVVAANENSQRFSPAARIEKTTSYMVIEWGRPGRPAPPPIEGSRVFLGGDAFFGRAMPAALSDELAAGRVEAAVFAVTGGAPLVVNLEGVLLPEVPRGLPHLTLAMPADLALAWLKRLHVAGVSLANNHARDLGDEGLAETRAALAGAGIAAADPGEAIGLPGLDVVALSDLDGAADPPTGRIDGPQLDGLVREGADRAVVALVHWGREWVTEPSPREEGLMAEFARRSVAVAAGAHPHRASGGLVLRGGGDLSAVFSLGNFLFDQSAARGASGALLELTAFGQGTVFPRLRPLPNLFDLARGAGPDG